MEVASSAVSSSETFGTRSCAIRRCRICCWTTSSRTTSWRTSSRGVRSLAGRPSVGHVRGAGLLRWLSLGATVREFAAGPAGLLWGAHVQAAWQRGQVCAQKLDRQGLQRFR
uniref:(northern house mosquito) hypothetical protein n=1 Tax=Culex pipiens TaxID=7175 RepID=A0A8D8EW87_CULPI